MHCKNFNVDSETFDMICIKVKHHLKQIYNDFKADKNNPMLPKEQIEKFYQEYSDIIDAILSFDQLKQHRSLIIAKEKA